MSHRSSVAWSIDVKRQHLLVDASLATRRPKSFSDGMRTLFALSALEARRMLRMILLKRGSSEVFSPSCGSCIHCSNRRTAAAWCSARCSGGPGGIPTSRRNCHARSRTETPVNRCSGRLARFLSGPREGIGLLRGFAGQLAARAFGDGSTSPNSISAKSSAKSSSIFCFPVFFFFCSGEWSQSVK